MKKQQFIFPLLVLLLTMITVSSCHVGDTNNETPATDKPVVAEDNTTVKHDSSSVMNVMKDSTVSVTAGKPNPAKKDGKSKVSVMVDDKPAGKMEMDQEGVYNRAEVKPGFPGGQKSLEKFFENNIEYPEDASANGVEGVVMVNFSVDENGKLYSPHIIGEKVGYGIDEEALRVVNKMPKWTAGKIKGKNVKTKFTLPIRFELY